MPQSLQNWAGLEGLMFTARTLVEGLYAGGHPSPRKGPGVEFHDYRAYVPGDDLARIDWKLYGRTDRYYLRQYQRYTDLQAYLLVDVSASMSFAGLDRRGRPIRRDDVPSKLDAARRLAAAIAFLAIRQGDRAGLGIAGAGLREHIPITGAWSGLQRICHTLESVQPAPGVGDLGDALVQAHRLLRGRGMVIVLSDLLDPPEPLLDGLSRLRHDRHDAIVFQILTPQERRLERLGPNRMQLVDSESRRQVATDVTHVARRYDDLFEAHLDAVRRGCIARGVDYNMLTTDADLIAALRRYLTRRAAVK